MVTGVPSSGMEYDDLSSPGLDTSVPRSVPRSVGTAVKMVDSVSVGAGSGGADLFLPSTPIVVPGCVRGRMDRVPTVPFGLMPKCLTSKQSLPEVWWIGRVAKDSENSTGQCVSGEEGKVACCSSKRH
jgi:hypothetical protein